MFWLYLKSTYLSRKKNDNYVDNAPPYHKSEKVLHMPFWSVIILRSVILERKKLLRIEKVARNRKSCPKVVQHLNDTSTPNAHGPITNLQRNKANSHIVNNLLTSNDRSLRENIKPQPCRIDLATAT